MNRQVLKYFFTVVALLGTTGGWAQNPPIDNLIGVYSTKEDFIANKISYQHERDAANDLKVDFNINIILKRKGVITKIRHGEVFGYYYQGQKYITFGIKRNLFSDIGYYKIEDEGLLIIYSEPGYRQNADHVFYFYSRQLDSPVRRLTFSHLRSDFKENQAFIDSLRKYRHTAKDRLNMKDCTGDEKIINQLLKEFSRPELPDSSARKFRRLPII
jgi:hypothetical protein